ncbi:MAG: SipW-dependent-type signal peptide-containing protein [Clostridia bacterium]|nr:SipW-dependent-type signal peptide-containing protein [Clostridia bacterium]
MKKKIVSMVMVFAMIAALAIGGTLAYFTDTDSATNTFTVGNVEIRLNEDERAEDGTSLQDFSDNKKLLPLVGSAQSNDKTTVDNSEYEVEADWQVPNAANWVDKIVSVTNTSTEKAYVRVLMAFPAKMDDPVASNMLMHWNIDRNMPDDEFWTYEDTGITITMGADMGTDYNRYNIYNFTYQPELEASKTTEWPAINGVYIDSRVDAMQDENGNITYQIAETGKSAFFFAGDGPSIYVLAQAVQADGFANAEEALEAGFPDLEANAQTWFNAVQD